MTSPASKNWHPSKQPPSSDERGIVKLAEGIAGIYPLASAEIYFRIDRKRTAKRNREQLESRCHNELAADRQRIQTAFLKTELERTEILERIQESESQHNELLPTFAQAAREAGIPLSTGSLTQEKLEAIVKEARAPTASWAVTPIPGQDDWRFKVYKALCAISAGLPLAVSIGGLYSVLGSEAFRRAGSSNFIVTFLLLSVIAVVAKLGAMLRAQNLGDIHAAARQGESEKGLWQEVWSGALGLAGYWGMVSLLEGVALRNFYLELHRYGTSHPQPLWVYTLVGGTLAGISILASHAIALTSGLRSLRVDLNKRQDQALTKTDGNLASLIELGSLLLSLKDRIAQDRKHLKTLEDEGRREPGATKGTLEQLAQARKDEVTEQEALVALVQKYVAAFTHLPHSTEPEPIPVPAPPKKVVKKRYYVLWNWFGRRNSKSDKSQ